MIQDDFERLVDHGVQIAGCTRYELLSTRIAPCVAMRHAIYYWLNRVEGYYLSDIARLFDTRHSSIHYGVQRIESAISSPLGDPMGSRAVGALQERMSDKTGTVAMEDAMAAYRNTAGYEEFCDELRRAAR